MLYLLAHALREHYGFCNLLCYVSVRAICALLCSLATSFIVGPWFLRLSQRYFRSGVREMTPQSHSTKNQTPTMGGLFILLVFCTNTLLWCNPSSPLPWLMLACVLGFGMLGLIDDWYKIHKRKGTSARTKFISQLLIAGSIATAWYLFATPDTRLCVPFLKQFMPHLGIGIIAWAVFVMVAASNGVNLTDGLDGLATGPLITNFITFGSIAYLAGHKQFAQYLYIPFAGSAELAVCACAMVGALLGFLWYNTHPAEIFMGDVGSLPLGAGLGLLALMTRQELLLPLAGGIFVVETVSVMLQVLSYRLRGKRLFKMAPIHHHFELLGWKETKVTVRFWIISLVLALCSLLTLKIR